MNDAEIAGKLDGMVAGNVQLIQTDEGRRVTILDSGDHTTEFIPADLLAFCREVVGKVDGVVKTPGSCGEYLKLSEKEKLRLMKQEASK